MLLVTSIFHDGISCTEKVHVGPIKCIFKVSAEAFFPHFLSVTKIKGEGDSWQREEGAARLLALFMSFTGVLLASTTVLSWISP